MIPDYYAILGVSPAANFATIRSAYRQLAMQFHPDRGGSHEQMIRINEAWNILANPASRAEYDQLRATHHETPAMAAAAAQARTDATVYPETWDAFDRWIDGIGKNFSQTRFKQSGWHGIFPATNTASGWIFMIAGGLVGFWICSASIASWTPEMQRSKANVLLGIVALGCWAGAWAHKITTKLFFHDGAHQPAGAAVSISTAQSTSPSVRPGRASSNADRSSESSRTDISCPKCNQALRVPALSKTIKVSCSRCGAKFLQHPIG